MTYFDQQRDLAYLRIQGIAPDVNPIYDANLGDVRFPPGGTPGYATLNLRCGMTLGASQRHGVNISLENITDKYYRVLGSGVDGPGFNAVVGYTYRH
ncbi:MAG: TonB-dependent receptor [Planctomycetales bacterium]|nr:TonB-dependent receptor [Planctomycetales bacterium]